ncbi:type III secretion system export apparatus subunit SctU [Chitinimonas koreensis]|uniref:type III secretion system export apparatus subunit SctU n=1 Tax=Chitinimonas koreensis TaxID=356302 RepID=UPI00041F1FEC|nr:type III secretion system export apparatus subunit SctU [Chitinimonas koreensis]QNM97648.1 type III secretion system export apparatus subunit SctU [Chitinimonas koreensis]
MSEKTEQPTHKKLEDARNKGQVAQSKDVVRLLACAALFELAFGLAELWRGRLAGAIELSLMRIGGDFDAALVEIVGTALIDAVLLLLPVAALAIVAVLIGTWMQIGLLFAPEALTPKFDKFNPAGNLQQMFSGRSLSQFLFNLAKSALVAWLAWRIALRELPRLMLLSTGTLADVWYGTLVLLQAVERACIGAFLALAAVDFGLQKYFHIRSLRMSMEDIKQEYKESEGDPHVKGHRRQLAHELASSGPAANTKKANAVVVNPTHFAVALHYLPEQTPLPLVLARGHDATAQAMIEVARAEGIPVIRYVPLARALYASGREGRYVPSAQLAAVALLYRAIDELLRGDAPADEIPEIDAEVAEAYLAELEQGRAAERLPDEALEDGDERSADSDGQVQEGK